jgi:hypothetical protein
MIDWESHPIYSLLYNNIHFPDEPADFCIILKELLIKGEKFTSEELFMIDIPCAIELLLDHGADINVIDEDSGITPIILASQENCVDLVKLYLKHGAKLDIKDSVGKTIYDHATGSVKDFLNSYSIILILNVRQNRYKKGIDKDIIRELYKYL